MSKRVLILCTGNSAHSQMAEGLLRHEGEEQFEVYSAGMRASFVQPEAIQVMREIGIDSSQRRPKQIDEFLGQEERLRHHRLRPRERSLPGLPRQDAAHSSEL